MARKTERLDQILIRLGYATPAQIEDAVRRQAARGGRFGTNLVEMGLLSEEQLFDALVEQFRVPTISVNESTVPRGLVKRMPSQLLTGSLVIPVDWNEEQKVLSVAVANPSDEESIMRAGQLFGARKVRVSIAPESVLEDLAVRLGGEPSGGGEREGVNLVALPELFEPESAAPAGVPSPRADHEAGRPMLLVARGAGYRNFLPTIMRAEGIGLRVASNADEMNEALAEGPVERVLVEAGLADELESWIASGTVPDPGVGRETFSSVAEALLENPHPYPRLARSVRAAVHALAEARCAQAGVSPSYALMGNDLEAMVERLGLGRVTADGLNIALHLLLPVAEPGKSIDPFQSMSGSIELARRLRFPWPVDTVLATVHGFFVGALDLGGLDDPTAESSVGAQLLALVWFRHNLVPRGETEEEAATAVRTSLRELAGRFAPLETIEGYLEQIAERGGGTDAARGTVLLVGGDRVSRALTPALARLGATALPAHDVASAQRLVDEHGPSAIVMDHAIFGSEVDRFGRVVKLGSPTPLFVLTDSTDPALVLNLLDVGVDDVFGPPHDFDLIAARINRGMRSHAERAGPEAEQEPGRFSATFEAFSFLDLAQMLANGMKTVRVDLSGPDGETALLHLVNGTPVHAVCGERVGPQAIYRIIAWDDRGEFTVSEDTEVPTQSIQESMESLLMEGVRLLDESRA